MAKASAPTPAVDSPASFEAALQELEAIVQAMEAGSAQLEDSLVAYERGVALLRHCQETLTAAESRIRILEGGVLREADATGEGGADN